jgi:arylsulfatase A-like enzyme
VAALQVAAILWAGWRSGFSPWWPLEALSASVSLLLLAGLVRTATHPLGTTGRFAFAAFLLLFVPLAAFHVRTGEALRFDLLKYTYEYLIQPDVLRWAVLDNGVEVPLILAGGSLGVGLLTAWSWRGARPAQERDGRTRPGPGASVGRALAAAALYLPFLLIHGIPRDDLTGLARGVVTYYRPKGSAAAPRASSPYPYVHGTPGTPPRRLSSEPPPNVFLVLLESFNARYVGATTDEGVPYTPFFNSLVERGVYVEPFYANSVQTIRGQLSALCGILESIKDRVAVAYPETRLHCLPEIFRELGYSTLFFEGYHDLGFDNTGTFMKRIGFDHVHAMTGEFIAPEDQAHVWGWGLQDDVFYRKVFAHLDRLRAEAPPAEKDRRLFVTLQSTTNHMWFDQVPEDKRVLVKNPRSLREHYANSLHLADRYLEELFRQIESRPELRDSLVVLTGDHGFPTDDRDGRRFVLQGFTEEGSRTPLLILWPGRLAPRRLDRLAHSQVDLGPTLLDLLDVEAPHHFIGRSVFEPGEDAERTVFTINPLGGTSILEVLHPMKYVKNLESGREYLYNVESDPEQKRNLIRGMEDSRILALLREELRKVYLNQELIEQNRVWPE